MSPLADDFDCQRKYGFILTIRKPTYNNRMHVEGPYFRVALYGWKLTIFTFQYFCTRKPLSTLALALERVSPMRVSCERVRYESTPANCVRTRRSNTYSTPRLL